MACMTEQSTHFSSFHPHTGDNEDNFKFGVMESSYNSNHRHFQEIPMETSSYMYYNSDNGCIITVPSDDGHFTTDSYPRHNFSSASFIPFPCSDSMLDMKNNNEHDGQQGRICLTTLPSSDSKSNYFANDVVDGNSNTSTSNEAEDKLMYPQYENVTARSRTFRDCVTFHHQNTKQFIDAGFFYLMFLDLVRCYCCGLELNNWKSTQDPMAEHARASPNCKYVRRVNSHKQESSKENDLSSSTKSLQDNEAKQSKDVESYPESTLRKNPLLTDAAQSVIKMGYLPKQVSKAIDEVLKYTDWIRMTSSDILGKLTEQKVLPLSSTSSLSHSDASGKSLPTNISSIKDENRTLKDRKLCKVCCEEDVSIVFLPCAHLVCCAQCAPAIQKCAVCRKPVKGTVRVAFSN